MNLGYLMIPRPCRADGQIRETRRLQTARHLGFSEFYCAEQCLQPNDATSSNAYPEHATVLRAMSDPPHRAGPQIVAINGKRQLTDDCVSATTLARPSVTPAQVKANAHQRQATLSVSWLNKVELARHWAAHVAGSTHAGIRAQPELWRIARTIVVCNDAARAEAAVKSKGSPCRAYYSKIAGPGAGPSDIDALLESCVLYGSLQSVLDEIHDISTTSCPFGTLTLVDHDWPDAALAQRSLASIANALAPAPRRSRAFV